MSDRAAAKAKTQLNVALTHLDQAARHAREAGLPGQAGTLERLARDAAEVLGKLQPARRPTLPVDQAAGGDDQAAGGDDQAAGGDDQAAGDDGQAADP